MRVGLTAPTCPAIPLLPSVPHPEPYRLIKIFRVLHLGVPGTARLSLTSFLARIGMEAPLRLWRDLISIWENRDVSMGSVGILDSMETMESMLIWSRCSYTSLPTVLVSKLSPRPTPEYRFLGYQASMTD